MYSYAATIEAKGGAAGPAQAPCDGRTEAGGQEAERQAQAAKGKGAIAYP